MKRIWLLCFCVCFLCLLFLYTAAVKEAVKEGLYYFSTVLIPALFPITFTTSFIMSISESALNKNNTRAMTFIFLFSLIGGYIVGAKLIMDGVNNKTITKKQGEFLSLFCVNGGIGFIISAVGSGVLHSRELGLLLYFINISYSLAGFLVFLPFARDNLTAKIKKQEKPVSAVFCDTVGETANIIIKIAGFVILFSAVNSCLESINAGFLSSFLEITTAVNKNQTLSALSFILGFGGISVICQILSVTSGIIDIKKFILSRLAHGVYSYLLAGVLIKALKIAVPVAASDKNITFLPVYDRVSVSVFIIISVIMLILSLEGKNRGGNLREDLLQ